MAGTGTLTVSGNRIGGNTGGATFPNASIVNTASTEIAEQQALATGDNTITIPAGTLGLYMLPIANTQVLKLKGNAADTGLQLSKTNPLLFPFDTVLPTFIINAAAATTVWIIMV